jgi:RNA polymerase sigma-70 factor (ECF subfamily)
MPSDAELFNERIRNGDITAFESLFKTYYVKLSLFANRFLNDLNASEEIVSDVFAFLWEKREGIVFTSSIQSYLYKTVQNRCLNYLKHKKIENEYVNHLVRNNLLEDYADNWNAYIEKDLEYQARKALDVLPDRCKEIFKLSRFNHLKNREIAQRLNLSEKTVERQITIALKKLRDYLKNSFILLLAWLLGNL